MSVGRDRPRELAKGMNFTFYGDLLGIVAAYRLGASIAYERLNEYYNCVFSILMPYQTAEPAVHVRMFSDSMLVWGKAQAENFLQKLQQVYLALFSKGLLLRGAIVDGALLEDHRLEGPDFRKFLPSNDTLARAVGLEKTHRGARCLVSVGLAKELLAQVPDWLTVDGYVRQPQPHTCVPAVSMLRRLCPTPSGSGYELLYFWSTPDFDYKAERARLREISQFLKRYVAAHYRETEELLRRSELRDLQSRQRAAV